MLRAIIDEVAVLPRDHEYQDFLKGVDENRRQSTAHALNARQNRLLKQGNIYVNGSWYMSTPTCENELVALYMKLEGAKQLPIECKILEYTSREGIDALANFRITDIEAFNRAAPVEFEYYLENFIAHEHFPGQVKLIICWDFSDGQNLELSSHPLVNEQWLKEINLIGYSVPTLLLSKVPGLEVRE